jgi:anti-anti-sigma regulatory factor
MAAEARWRAREIEELRESMRPDGCEMTLLALKSEITSETAFNVREALRPVLERPGHVVLDLRGATLDSRGLSVVLSFQRRLELQERLLAVISTDPRFFQLLDRVGVPGALTLFQDMEPALEYVRSADAAALAA